MFAVLHPIRQKLGVTIARKREYGLISGSLAPYAEVVRAILPLEPQRLRIAIRRSKSMHSNNEFLMTILTVVSSKAARNTPIPSSYFAV
jgi:hypothetical protein